MKKLFVIRKYVMAENAKKAIVEEKKHPVDDVWIDDDWKKENLSKDNKKIGFNN
jgi:hypothetical protein